ncbi:MAG: dockerin type I domain-containing protein, partial [Candidatus Poribacteria bacterium]|nr:dockerin type I domain-containing protein [Candidatus Poribacteria bacterium]
LWDIPPAPNTTGIVSLSLASVPSPAVGARIVLNITDGENVAGYQATLTFDPSALRHLESADGGYFPGGAFAVPAGVTANQTTLAVTPSLENAEITVSPQIAGDVNQDGVVNIQDLVLVAGHFGQAGETIADVNADGIVNIQDLVLVAAALGDAAAPPARDPEAALTRADVKAWLAAAHRLTLTDATSRRGVLFLENLLVGFTPKNTALLPNYPNPFNPETWIPYRLAEDADVRITIYDTAGGVVRQLDFGRLAIIK